MTATNHVLTGAIIGASIGSPLLALPIALLSHFLLDAVPHYSDETMHHAHKSFIAILFTDMVLAASILIWLALMSPVGWQIMVACAVVAASPDLMWLPPWLIELKGKIPKPFGKIRQFHHAVQWSTKPWGILVELAWALTSFIILAKLVVV
jgi:hypothetical protein